MVLYLLKDKLVPLFRLLEKETANILVTVSVNEEKHCIEIG